MKLHVNMMLKEFSTGIIVHDTWGSSSLSSLTLTVLTGCYLITWSKTMYMYEVYSQVNTYKINIYDI